MNNQSKFIENYDIEILAKFAIEDLSQKATQAIADYKDTNDVKYKTNYLNLINDREKILNFDKETIIKYCKK